MSESDLNLINCNKLFCLTQNEKVDMDLSEFPPSIQLGVHMWLFCFLTYAVELTDVCFISCEKLHGSLSLPQWNLSR